MKKGRKRKAPAVSTPKVSKKEQVAKESDDKETEAEAPTTEEKTETDTDNTTTPKEKPAKKAKKPQVEGMNSGVYNELEEKHFLEGLETYGRDWGKVKTCFIIKRIELSLYSPLS